MSVSLKKILISYNTLPASQGVSCLNIATYIGSTSDSV
jgi:hypothetical protein